MKPMKNSSFTIEDAVFVYCPVSYKGKVIVPDGITDIGDKAFLIRYALYEKKPLPLVII